MADTMDKLLQLRTALMRLHKALLEYEKKRYEHAHGRVGSAGRMFDLALQDSAFAWLRQLSELIVGIDGLFDNKEHMATSENTRDLFRYTKKMLTASLTGGRFEKKYYSAIQAEPAVALAHARVMEILKSVE